MTRVDWLGDRTCVAMCWIGLVYILYSHVI